MADDAIVQEIEISGIGQAITDFQKLGEAGEASFDKIEKGAQRAGGELSKAGDEGDKAGKKISSGNRSAGDSAAHLQKVEGAAVNMGSALSNAGSAVGSFAKSVGLIVGAATAAVGGIVLLARSVSGAADGGAQSTKQLSLALKIASQIQTQAAVSAVANKRAFSDLDFEFSKGKLSVADYHDKIQELERTQKNAAKDAEETARIQAAANQKRLQDLAKLKATKTFGADLAGSLIKLGVGVESFWKKFIAGPSFLARAVDILTQLLKENGDAIIGFYQRIVKSILTLFDFKSGEADITALGVRFRAFGEEVTTTIETVVIPAVKQFLVFVGVIATAINALFGTNFSAQGLLFTIVLFKMLGAFKLLTAAITVCRTVFLLLSVAFAANPIGLLIIALVLLAALLIGLNWDTVKKKAGEAWDWIKRKWDEAGKFFSAVWNLITAAASVAWEWIKQLPSDAWEWIKQKWNEAGDFFAAVWNVITAAASAAWEWIKTGATDAWDWIVEKFNQLIEFFANFPETIGTVFLELWDEIKQGASDAWDWIVETASEAWAKVANFFEPVTRRLTQLIALAKQVAQAIGLIGSGDGSPPADAPALAGGGQVRGPGTATSDSVLARLSDGEFVVRTKRVKQLGLRFMNWVNSGSGTVPQFNMGGLVRAMGQSLVPHFASGGIVSQPRGTGAAVILNIGNDSFHLLTRDNDTADQLGRVATRRRIASTGRKPGYYGA